MGRIQALFFACIGVALLLAVSFAVSLRSTGWTLLFAFLSLSWIGFGFAVKAKARRNRSGG